MQNWSLHLQFLILHALKFDKNSVIVTAETKKPAFLTAYFIDIKKKSREGRCVQQVFPGSTQANGGNIASGMTLG